MQQRTATTRLAARIPVGTRVKGVALTHWRRHASDGKARPNSRQQHQVDTRRQSRHALAQLGEDRRIILCGRVLQVQMENLEKYNYMFVYNLILYSFNSHYNNLKIVYKIY